VAEPPATSTPLLSARHVSKRFPGVEALHDIIFDLHAGEVHALIGENGAGKSTLVKILSGEITDYDGQVLLNGTARRFDSPRQALAAGIAVIPQELHLVRSLTVAGNIYLGREPRGPGGMIDRAALEADAARHLDDIGATGIAPDALVESLAAAARQMVAIAHALSSDARCLIMDEPTASLGGAEASRLEDLVRALMARGVGVIYISHKLDEIKRLATRVTVLRDGHRITTRGIEGLDEDEMVRLMVGRDIVRGTLVPVAATAPERLGVSHLDVPDRSRPDGYLLHDVSFHVRAGEIVGLAGLIGAGRTDLLTALVGGLNRPVHGEIRIDGQPVTLANPAAAQQAGIMMLPEERKANGIFPDLGVGRNVTISALGRVSQLGWINRRRDRGDAVERMTDAGVRAAGPDVPIAALSGGNQQKALLARCLYASPRVLLLDEPTRGIDLAAKAEIYAELHALAASGMAILLASSEMSEVLTQCHRILVVRSGAIVGAFDRDDATEEKVLAVAAGQSGPQASADNTQSAPGSPSAPPPVPPAAARGARFRGHLARYVGLFGLALVLVLAITTSPIRGGRLVFLDLGNLTDILRQVAEKGILAVGMTAVIISGGIDLSVGSILAFGATLSALLWMRAGMGFWTTALIVIGASALWGWINGIVIARWRLPAFIVTLATMSAARGAARYLSGGTAIPLGFGAGGAPAAVHDVASPILPYVPAPALIFALTAIAMGLYLARTRGGRYVYAIGDNEAAARLAGIRVSWHVVSVYVMSAALAGLAGLVHCAQLQQGNPNDGVAYELDAIAAAVIGGTALSGGTGTVGGTIIGILIIGIIGNAMGLNNVDANLQLILKGVIILVAVWLQRRRPS
jgi:ABC-type sugar transport system ATPase subunit/ribose/xylose/arabinose/galactoside ABC-type transport system permease subunit